MILRGLRADNLLSWMAAIGVSKSLDVGLKWAKVGPLWLADVCYERDDIVDRLYEVCKLPPMVLKYRIDKGVKFESIEQWREFAREQPDWASAFGGDTGEELMRSPLLMSSGGGHQHPLTMVAALSEHLEIEDVASAIHGPWRRGEKYGLRLDPAESRQHADRWDEPSKDRTPNVAWGPSRLAWEALPALPCSGPDWRSIYDRRGKVARWPVWDRYARGRALTAMVWTRPPAFECRRWHVDKGNYSVTPAMPVVESRMRAVG